MLSFICFIGIFSDRETLELLAASISFEDLLPRLSFIWFCCLWGTIPLVFIFDFRKCYRLSETQFFSSRWMAYSFFICGLPHISFNFPVGTVHLILCDCHTMLFHFFFLCWSYQSPCFLLFHSSPWCCADCHTSCFFFGVEPYHFSLYECHTNILCVSISFMWMSHKYPCVSITSRWTHTFVSFWVIFLNGLLPLKLPALLLSCPPN